MSVTALQYPLFEPSEHRHDKQQQDIQRTLRLTYDVTAITYTTTTTTTATATDPTSVTAIDPTSIDEVRAAPTRGLSAPFTVANASLAAATTANPYVGTLAVSTALVETRRWRANVCWWHHR
jgi:hypothetical protein